MIVLGLGSNVGDRLGNLRLALTHLKKIPGLSPIKVSPVYVSDALLPDGADSAWDMPFLNAAVSIETNLAPHKLLQAVKEIENRMGRDSSAPHWGPRIIDIDILTFHDVSLQQDGLSLPHPGLLKRPFALWPLADVSPFTTIAGKEAAELIEPWGSRFSGNAPFHTRQINQRIDTPALMGILNITPDSFSDGGKFFTVDKAFQQALALLKDGAEILDIGAESTAPSATALTQAEEWARLKPVLEKIKAHFADFLLPPKISIDTRYAKTAENALTLGVDWINDVNGLQDKAMRDVVLKSSSDCIMMHSLSIPASREHLFPYGVDVVSAVYEWGEKQLESLDKLGIARERIIFDPGIGFGKRPSQSLALLKNAALFNQLGTRLLIGHSRKFFLTQLTPFEAKDRDIETLAISLALAKAPIDYLRVHDVASHARAFKAAFAL